MSVRFCVFRVFVSCALFFNDENRRLYRYSVFCFFAFFVEVALDLQSSSKSGYVTTYSFVGCALGEGAFYRLASESTEDACTFGVITACWLRVPPPSISFCN